MAPVSVKPGTSDVARHIARVAAKLFATQGIRRNLRAHDRRGRGGDQADTLLPLREQGRACPCVADRPDVQPSTRI